MPAKGKSMRKKVSSSRKRPVGKAPASSALPPTEKIANMKSRFFDVRQSSIQGKGAFATSKIRKGQRIIEYTGERISNDEADSRYDEAGMRRHHTFLFTVTPRVVVDGAVNGNESIYINHSCDPNCEAVIDEKRIFIEAIRTIHPGEELAYDYQYERTGEDDDEMEKFYKCLCGAPNCRGSIMKSKPAPRVRKSPRKAAKKSVRRKRS